MTLDGLLTFLTLVVGALTFMSPVARLRLRLALGLWVLWSAIGLFGALYFEFFDVVAPYCQTWFVKVCKPLEMEAAGAAGAVTPQRAAFLVVLGWLLLTGLGLVRSRVHGWSMKTLSRLQIRLVHERRFQWLIDLTEPNLVTMDRFAGRRGRMQRLHDWLTPKPWEMSPAMRAHAARKAAKRLGGDSTMDWPFLVDDRPVGGPTMRERFVLSWGPNLAKAVPSGATAEAAAGDVLRTLMTRREIIDVISRDRPAFGAKLLGLEEAVQTDFPDRFLQGMIERPGSALYEEVENSQNLIGCSYVLASDAWILHALLDDARVAERLHAYDPVSTRLLAMLNPVNEPVYVASLNKVWDHSFGETGIWRDPAFVTVRYLDLVVRAAACQGVADHMWVYYLADIAEALEAQYDDSATDIDPTDEWPIRSGQILYAIIDLLVDLVRIVDKLPEGSPHLSVESDRIDRGTVNIPKAAAVTLGDAMKAVISSDRIPERFKAYLLEIAIRWLRDRAPKNRPDWVRPTVIAAISRGGTMDGGDTYRAALGKVYEHVDRPWISELADFEMAIGYPTSKRS